MKKKTRPFSVQYGLHEQLYRHVDNKAIAGKKILDVGCGNGWIEEMLLAKGARKVIGIDISQKALDEAISLRRKKVKYVNASALKIPFKNNFFDGAVCFEVLEHVPPGTENKMFEEIYRILKTGGIFYLSTPHRNWFAVVMDPAWWLIGHRHYKRDDLKKFARKAGFKVQKMYVKGMIYTVFLLLSQYTAKWLTHSSPIVFEYLNRKSKEEFRKEEGFMTLFFSATKRKSSRI